MRVEAFEGLTKKRLGQLAVKGLAMRLFLSIVTFGFLSAAHAMAELKRVDPLGSVRLDLKGWYDDFGKIVSAIENEEHEDSDTGYIECRLTRDIEGTYLCQFQHFVYMNRALDRISYFVEGSSAGELLTQNDKRLQTRVGGVNGHNLKSHDLLLFYQKANEECKKARDFCLNKHEEELYAELVFPALKEQKDFVLLAFSYFSRKPYQDIVTHEMLHAFYFLKPKFKEVVDGFWENRVEGDDKNQINTIFRDIYDGSNESVVRNEFQAYLLQANADKHLLRDYLKAYRGPLLQALAKEGFGVILLD